MKGVNIMQDELIVLESMDAASEFIAQEGFFSNLKHVRQVKKAAKTEARNQAMREREESYAKLKAHNEPIIKSILNKAVAKCKSKKEWKSLPWDIRIYECEGNYDVEIFTDEGYVHEYDEKYNPEALEAFKALIKMIEPGVIAAKDKFEGCGEGYPKVEIYEHNLITISLMS